MSVQLLTEHHLEFLGLTGGCTGSYESTLVKMPHCWKSHVAAQLCKCLREGKRKVKRNINITLWYEETNIFSNNKFQKTMEQKNIKALLFHFFFIYFFGYISLVYMFDTFNKNALGTYRAACRRCINVKTRFG